MTRKHLRPAPPAARKRRRKDFSPPDIPDPSDELVSHILEEGAIEKAHHALVKSWLIALRNDYDTDLKRLGYYASNKQIVAGLATIRNRASQLVMAMEESKAVHYALMEHYICSDSERLPNTSDLESEHYVATLEDDIAGVSRIKDLASDALKRWPKGPAGHYEKKSALKPGGGNCCAAEECLKRAGYYR